MAQAFQNQLLLKARLELGLTQEQAAESLGVDARTYRRYESGAVNTGRAGFNIRTPGRRRIIEAISSEFGIPATELVAEKEKSPPKSAESTIKTQENETPPYKALHIHPLAPARFFGGRESELEHLSHWIAHPSDTAHIIALIGLGGAGKTSLAERLLHRLGDKANTFGIFVWSFYEDTRTEYFLEQAAQYFASPTSHPSAPNPAGERLDALCHALRSGPAHLLVLDGLEIVQSEGHEGRAHGELNDPLLKRLLCSISKGLGQSRALITTRFPMSDLAPWEGRGFQSHHLGSLSPEQGADILRRWGVSGSDRERLRLAKQTGGHALSLSVLGSFSSAFLGGAPMPIASLDLSDLAKDDALARRLSDMLKAYAEALRPEERELMTLLSMVPGGLPQDTLFSMMKKRAEQAGVPQIPGIELRRALSRLVRLGLLSSTASLDGPVSTHPFIREYFRSRLSKSFMPAEIRFSALSSSPAPLLNDLPHTPPRDPELLDAYEVFCTSLIEEKRYSEAYRLYMRGLFGFSHLGLRLGEMSRGFRLMRAFAHSDDPSQMPIALPGAMRASLMYEWGLYAGALGDLAFACRCYMEHNAIVQAIGPRAAHATGLRTLSYTERLMGHLPQALATIERSQNISDEAGELEHSVRATSLMASILHDMGKTQLAAELFAQLEGIRVPKVARRGLWEAEHLIDLGQLDKAQAMTEQNISVCTQLDWEGHVAHGHAVLGHIALLKNRLEEARAYLHKARLWAGKTGEVEMVLRCYELSMRIELAAGALDLGKREAKAGFELADACGFALFRGRFEMGPKK